MSGASAISGADSPFAIAEMSANSGSFADLAAFANLAGHNNNEEDAADLGGEIAEMNAEIAEIGAEVSEATHEDAGAAAAISALCDASAFSAPKSPRLPKLDERSFSSRSENSAVEACK